MNKNIKVIVFMFSLSLVCLFSSVIVTTGAWFTYTKNIGMVTITPGSVEMALNTTLSASEILIPTKKILYTLPQVTADATSSDMYVRAYVEINNGFGDDVVSVSSLASGWNEYDGFYYYTANSLSDTSAMSNLATLSAGKTTSSFMLNVEMLDVNKEDIDVTKNLSIKVIFQAVQCVGTTDFVIKDSSDVWGSLGLSTTVYVNNTATSVPFEPGDTVEGITQKYNANSSAQVSDENTCGWFYDENLIQTVANYSTTPVYSTTTLYTKTASDSSNFTFTADNETSPTCYYISASSTDISGDIVLPAKYNGLPVALLDAATESDGSFYNCTDITSVTLSNKITTIGRCAFPFCTSLSSVNLPETLTRIGSDAFFGCTSLNGIVIPEGVTSIGNETFYGCTSISSIVIPEGVTSLGEQTFRNCTSLSSISLPDGVTSIGSSVFKNCSILSSVKLSESLTSIGDSAFYECKALTSIELPDSLTSIGGYTFYYCNSLLSIEIPNLVTSIGRSAFSYCSALTSIEIPNSVTSIGVTAFQNCTALTSMEIPEGITTLSNYIFMSCSNLSEVVLPESLTSIGAFAFSGCTSLSAIDIPEGVTSIGASAFSGCTSLSSIDIPDGVTSIGYFAFRNCTSLSSIEIPEGVTSIGYYAFDGCPLTSVTFKTTDGWWVSTNPSATSGTVVADAGYDLSDTSVAANCLTNTYCYYYWNRTTSL